MNRHITRLPSIALALLLALSLAACLEKETSSIVYVEADGSVTWTILESGVHSDSADPDAARREERDYLAEHRAGWTELAKALAAMGGLDIQAHVLRDRAPFETHTSARFDGLEVWSNGYCAARRWPCTSQTAREGAQTTWTWTIAGGATGSDQADEVDGVMAPLDEALVGLRVRLAAGRFVSARGFQLAGAVATLDSDAWEGDQDEYTLSLTWTRDTYSTLTSTSPRFAF
ncbi:MAG TPA: hypothetical protein VK911_02275 [Vicinamibacterales bacterium]|nr:hypothetical protein [Vicinamibacterales bacterium]